jgi:aminopeptidase N
VRRAVAAALSQFRVSAVVQSLRQLIDNDPSYLVVSEACRALGRSRQKEAKSVLLPRLEQASWADVVRSGAVDGLAELRDPELIPSILSQTRYGTPSRGRRAAVLALGRIGTDRSIREQLELLLDDADPHLRADVVDALLTLGQPEAQAKLAAKLEQEPDPRVQRRLREAMRDLGAHDRGATKRLSDDLVALKDKVAELEAQVSRLDPAKSTESNQPEKPAAKSPKPRPVTPAISSPKRRAAEKKRAAAKTTSTRPGKRRAGAKKVSRRR